MLGPAFEADLAQLHELFGAGRADDQHKATLATRQAGRAPQIYFTAAREMPWRSTQDYQPFTELPEISYPSPAELKAELGFNIACVRADQLPHADVYRQGRQLTAEEISVRGRAVAAQLADADGYAFYADDIASRLTPAFVGAYDAVSPVAAQQACHRLAGEAVQSGGVLLMAHQLNNEPLQHATFHCWLDPEMIRFVPERSRFGPIFMRHELAHAAQRASWAVLENVQKESVRDVFGYVRETDADAGGLVDAWRKDGVTPGELSMYVAFRALSMVTQNWMLEHDPFKYGGSAMLVSRGLKVSEPEAVAAQMDLKLRIAAQLMGKPVNITPQDMTGNVQRLMQGQSGNYHPEFVRAYDAFNSLALTQSDRTTGLLWRPQGISHGLEKVWYGGEKLSPLTLRMAGMAVEALSLYRHGPAPG